MANKAIQTLKKLLYGDLDPEYYKEVVDKISDKLTDLKLIKQGGLLRALLRHDEQIRQQILSNLNINRIERDRFSRYRTYEKLYQAVPELYQAVGIYTDNILSPDVVSKEVLLVMSTEQTALTSDRRNSTRAMIKSIIEQTNLENHIEEIVKTTLTYGDCFVEIVDANPLVKQYKFLQEQVEHVDGYVININPKFKDEKEIFESVIINQRVIQENEETNSLSRIKLRIHNPKHVVAFYAGETPLGFLIVKPVYVSSSAEKNYQKEFLHRLANVIVQKQSNIKKIIDEYPGFRDDIANILALIDSDKAEIRFVPADRMVHFKIPSTVFAPYGESLFTPVADIAKYVIAAERALLIYRLTRAPEKRIFKVNVFEDTTEVSGILQEVIRETKQKEVAISQSGDIDALMSEITMFDDIYIPVVDGQPAFEIETIPGGELNAKIEDLQYYKDKMIAGLSIPPIYLKPQDQQVDNKSTLAQENARFARTIIRFQKAFTEKLTDLVHNIVQIVEPDKLIHAKLFQITFHPPTALMAEREQEIVNAVTTMIDALSKYNIPPKVLLKKYLPQFDWDQIEEETAVDEKLDKLTGQTTEEEE